MSCMDETAARRLRAAEEILAADRACARVPEPSGPQVLPIGAEAVANPRRTVGALPALLILSHAEARALAADITAATT
ncbi:hypothetical protein GS498_25490 [Rhodococcus hoagii]|nr:hypothetical protein [Prescottella equi]